MARARRAADGILGAVILRRGPGGPTPAVLALQRGCALVAATIAVDPCGRRGPRRRTGAVPAMVQDGGQTDDLDALAHDLLNLLAAIKGQAQLGARDVRRRDDADPILPRLAAIDAQVDAAAGLVAKVRQAAQPAHGGPTAPLPDGPRGG